MLPEQVWDYDDLPSEGMYFGKSAGSAQPLVWAHSEYLKLLRSATDGRIFDRISVVEERYAVAPGKRSFTSQIEIFQIVRPISSIPAGLTLRIVDHGRFRIVYTFDDWATVNHLDAHSLGPLGYFADLPTTAEPDRQNHLHALLARPESGPAGSLAGQKYGSYNYSAILIQSFIRMRPGPVRLVHCYGTIKITEWQIRRPSAPRLSHKKEKNERPAAVR